MLSGDKMRGITVDKFVIMPNHIHIILLLTDETPAASSPANAAIPRFVSALKRFRQHDIGEPIFRRSYHDHVIRDENDYRRIRQYIDTNPARRQEDCFYEKPCGG